MPENTPAHTGVKKQVHRKKNYDMNFCACGCGTLIFISDRWGGKHRFVNGHGTKGKSKYSNPKMIPCGCGCGTLIPEFNKWGKNRRFVNGHGTKGKDINKTAKTNLIPCACGCGTLIPEMNKYGKKQKYVHGHYNRGKTFSAETKEKLSKIGKDRRFTLETRNKMSESGKGRIFTKEHRKKISKGNKGKKRSPEMIFKMTGENNHAWNGGSSFFPYCDKFNNQLKEKVRNRDNRTCQNCGVKENGKKLPVHHIHYDKENCYPDLITVCNSCNSKANSNRDYWETFYINKLNERGLLFWTQNNGD